MCYWRYDPKSDDHTTDGGPQAGFASFLVVELLVRVYFGVNWALGFAAFVAFGAAIGWLLCRHTRRASGRTHGAGT